MSSSAVLYLGHLKTALFPVISKHMDRHTNTHSTPVATSLENGIWQRFSKTCFQSKMVACLW